MVAASLILVETVAVFLLKQVAPVTGFGVVFLLGVLVVSMVWGWGLTVSMSVVSAFALGYFRNWPTGHFASMSPQSVVDIAVFLIVALSTNFIARRARAREIEAEAATAKLQDSRDKLGELAERQAALRRVATLVARGARPSEVFSAVAEEIVRCLNVDTCGVWRYGLDDAITLLAASSKPGSQYLPVGERLTLEGENLGAMVLRSGVAARHHTIANCAGSAIARIRELGIREGVGAPIIVDGRIWGVAIAASTRAEPLPPDTEERIGDFADLVATTLSSAATRDELRGSRDQLGELAEQQAALRRVATLVACGVEPSEVFGAVTDEMRRCLGAWVVGLWRFEASGEITLLAAATEAALLAKWPVGTRTPVEGNNIASAVLRTGRPARMDTYEKAAGPIAARVRAQGVRAAVGVPIIVDGRVWGLVVVGSAAPGAMPADTEARISDFAELVATAIANAATRDELIASRARIVAAADDARRRLERDLHDGTQQRLVALGLQVRLAEASVRPEQADLKELLSTVVSGLTGVFSELQQISRGIHPAILSKGGLEATLKTVARRCSVPVNLDTAVEQRLPEPVEIAAYYVVAEALTNAAKYAHASQVNVRAETKGATLHLSIQDDGIGGADPRKGSGLIGLKDRVETLGGHMQLASDPGSGTSLHITIPVKGNDTRRSSDELDAT